MHNIPPLHRQKIQKAMSDPRYWNKKHPEHAEAFANAQRAFEDAYRESPLESETSPESVHVRAYTRTQDGKEIEVSAYDRIQQVALRGPTTLQAPPRDDVDETSNNPLHDAIVDDVAKGLAAAGAIVAKDMRFTSSRHRKWSADPDLFVLGPDGLLYLVEVKTGRKRPALNMRQRVVYRALADGEAFTDDPRIRAFGFLPGFRIPPVCVYSLWARYPGDTYKIDVMAGGRKCEADVVPEPDGPPINRPI